MGSPPPAGSKNDVFRLRSVSNIVIAPASTGKDSNSNKVVIIIAQTNKGTFSKFIPFGRIFFTVDIKLIEPRMEETPAKWREKIAISTAGPPWDKFLDNGG